MKYTLHKLSSPGWSKTFETEQETFAELSLHVCRLCKHGEEWIVGPDDNLVQLREPSPPAENIDGYLATPCGCEYDVEVDFDDIMEIARYFGTAARARHED